MFNYPKGIVIFIPFLNNYDDFKHVIHEKKSLIIFKLMLITKDNLAAV